MVVLFVAIFVVAELGTGFSFHFPPGLFRRLNTIEDYPKVANLPPFRTRYERWVRDWRSRHEECGHPVVKPGLPYFNIVGGQEAKPGSWPWMISLRYDVIQMHGCGASLIDKEWLVTAAHCFEKRQGRFDTSLPDKWTVRLGKFDVSVGVTEEIEIDRRIAKLYVHPKTDKGTLHNNDIALIKLDEPVEMNDYISPLCLPSHGMKFEGGTDCVVTGWGLTENPEDRHVLRQATVPIISRSECRHLPHFSVLTPNMMCAGYPSGGADACQFDSGGPIQCQMSTQWYQAGLGNIPLSPAYGIYISQALVCFRACTYYKHFKGRHVVFAAKPINQGITSFGFNGTCGQPAQPGVYTDLTKYIDWIFWHMFLDPYF